MSSDQPKKRIPKFAIVLAVTVVACVGIKMAWSVIYPSATWRYKMTINVETPEGLKTGSAVREVTVVREPKIAEYGGGSAYLTGEAVVVDLGKYGQIFALLKDEVNQDYGYMVVFDAYKGPPGLSAEGIKYYSQLKNAEVILSPDQYPMLVTFEDINNPKTVKNLDPKNLEQDLGKGVKLQSVIIEMTDEAITAKIDNYLKWLSSRKDIKGYLGGSPDKPIRDPSNTFLTGIEFKQGIK